MSRYGRVYFNRQHQWISLRTGYVGITKWALEDEVMAQRHWCKFFPFKDKVYAEAGEQIGVVLVKSSDRWYTSIHAPYDGIITHTNTKVFSNQRRLVSEYLFRITPTNNRPVDLLTYHDYMSWVLSLNN